MNLPKPSIRKSFSSLQYPNFKLWFLGQLASLIGTWMQTTAIGFLSYDLTRSPAFLGSLGFANGAPTLFFALYGGVVSDRFNKRNILLATQFSMMCIAIILTALIYTQSIRAWMLLALSFLNGIANAFDAPARQSFIRELVPKEDLPNALALNAMMFNGALAVGPAVGGFLYALYGPALCFGINALSFIAVIVALLFMELDSKQMTQTNLSAFSEIKTGIRYIGNHTTIRTLLLIVAVTNIFGAGYVTLFPAWAVEVLHGDSTTLGFLQASRGLGAALGALMIASFGRFQFKGRLLTLGLFLYPIFLCLFSLTSSHILSSVLLIFTGWWFIVVLNMSNTLIQTHVEDGFRGRVMSVYSLALLGMVPIGSLIFGTIAELFKEQLTLFSGSLIALLFAFTIFFTIPSLRTLP